MNNQPLIERSTCTALVITCSDFRFKSAERAFVEASGLTDDYDLIARPGAARALVAPRSEALRETLWQEIELLWSVHHFPRILLVHHVSCRAYDDIATPETEHDVHADHLRRASTAIDQRMNSVRAELYFADTTPQGITVGAIA